MTLALIDGDIIVYRCGFASERNWKVLKWEGGQEQFRYQKELDEFIEANGIEEYELETYLEVEPLSHSLASVKSIMSTVIKETKADDYKVYMTEGKCFRHDNATIAKYKGNRDGARRPEHYHDIREYLEKYYGAVSVTGYEADDMLAMEQTDDTVICSIDKDLLQVPGKHFNWVTGTKLLVSPITGLRSVWAQVLSGDSTDNIPGIKGIGPVKSKRMMEECNTAEEMRDVAVAAWKEYLDGDNPPEWVYYDDEDDIPSLYYTHWETGERMPADPERIVDEIYGLVQVGDKWEG